MPTLDNLPTELVKAFAGLLPKQDLSNLRLVSRKLEDKSFDVFKIYLKKKTIMLARPSLEALLALSEDKRLAPCVQTLRISSDCFQLRTLQAGVTLRTVETVPCELTGASSASLRDSGPSDNEIAAMANEHEEHDNRPIYGPSPPFSRPGFTSSQFQAYAAFLNDQMRSEKNQDYVKLLSRAFSNLQNLRGISFHEHVKRCGDEEASNWGRARGILGIGRIVDAIGSSNVDFIKEWPSSKWSFEPQMSCVLEAVVMSRLPLNRLTARTNYRHLLDSMSDDPERLRPYERPSISTTLKTLAITSNRLSNVKSLGLEFHSAEISGDGLIRRDLRDFFNDVDFVELRKMLQLFPNVSALSLGPAIPQAYALSLPTKDFRLTKLKTLSIGAYAVSAPNLARFFTAHKDTLQDVTFHATRVVDSAWNQLASTIPLLPKLERLEFKKVDNGVNARFELDHPAMSASLASGSVEHNTTSGSLGSHGVTTTPGILSPGAAHNAAAGGGLAAAAGMPADLYNGLGAFLMYHNLLGPMPIGPATPQASAAPTATVANSTSTAAGGNVPGQSAPANPGQPTPNTQLFTGVFTLADVDERLYLLKPYNSIVLHLPDIAGQVSRLPF